MCPAEKLKNPLFLTRMSDITDMSVTGYKVLKLVNGQPEYHESRVLARNVRIKEFTGHVNLLNLEFCNDIYIAQAVKVSALNLSVVEDFTVPWAREVNLHNLIDGNVYAVRAKTIIVGPKFRGHIFCALDTKIISTRNKSMQVTRFFTPVNAMRYSLKALTR